MIIDHVFIISFKKITSRITDILTISLDEIAHKNILNTVLSKSKKDDGGLCRFVLAQSSAKMDTYLRQPFSYLFNDVDVSESKRILVSESLRLHNNIKSSYALIISENIPKTLGMIDQREFFVFGAA